VAGIAARYWVPLALAIGAFALLSPGLSTGWFGDDTLLSTIPGALARVSFWDMVSGLYLWGLHTGVRRPGLDLVTIAVFAVFTNRFVYKLFLLALTLLALELARRCFARWWGTPFANAGSLCTILCFQIRNYHDPLIAYNAVQQLVAIGTFGSILLFTRWLETGRGKFLVASIAAFVLAASCYETVYLLCILHVIVAWWKRSFAVALRKAAPFITIGASLCALELATLWSAHVAGTEGYAMSSDVVSYLRALGDQLSAALPLSYPLSQADHRTWPPKLFLGLPVGMGAVLLFLWFAGLSAAIFKLMRGRVAPNSHETIPFGLALWILPALLIALSAKYQHELHFGLGYLPVLLEYFGAGIVSATVLAKAMGTLARPAALAVVVGVFPGIALATFASNRLVEIETRAAYLTSRDAFVAALEHGLLSGVGPNATVGIAAQLPWVVQGGATSSDLIYQVTKRRLTVVPEPGAATVVVSFDASHERWIRSVEANRTLAFQPFTLRLREIAVGNRSSVWALDGAGNVFKLDAASKAFEQMPVRLVTLSVAKDGTTWGINGAGQVFRYDGKRAFRQVPGSLKAVSVGNSRSVWGLNARGQIYRFDSARDGFQNVPGLLSSLSVGADGIVFGLNGSGNVFRYDGRRRFELIPGNLVYLQAADRERVWGINASGFVFKYDENHREFANVPGRLTSLSVGSDGTVWGINSENEIFRYDRGVFRGVPGLLSRVAVADGACVWGITPNGEASRVTTQIQLTPKARPPGT